MTRRTAVALLVLSATLPACKSKEQAPAAAPPPEVGVAAVAQRDVPIVVEMIGQTLGASDVEIRARVQGWVLGMHFAEGSEVKKGALLYTIDSSELNEKVAQAAGNVASAQTRLAQAESDVKRYRPLAAMNAVSQRDLELAIAQEGAAKGAVDAAQAALEVARINLGYARVTAPISGLIGISKVKVGDFVGLGAGSLLNTVSLVDPIHVRVSISEREYLDLARKLALRGDRASDARQGIELLLADGTQHAHKGQINFTDRQVDPSTGALLIEAEFPNPEKLLRPGQFARIRAVAEIKKDALLVPQRSVQELQGNYFVYTVDSGNKVAMKPVKTGVRLGEQWLIEEGVSAGDRVVVEGLQRVRPDLVVAPKPMAEAAAGGGAGEGASEPKSSGTEH